MPSAVIVAEEERGTHVSPPLGRTHTTDPAPASAAAAPSSNPADPSPDTSAQNYLVNLQAITALLLQAFEDQLTTLGSVGQDINQALTEQGALGTKIAEDVANLAAQVESMAKIAQDLGIALLVIGMVGMGAGGALGAAQSSVASVAKSFATGMLSVVRLMQSLLAIVEGAVSIAKAVFQSEMTEKSGMAVYLQTSQENLSSAFNWATGEMKSSLSQEKDINETFMTAAYAIQNGLTSAFQLRA